MRNMSKKTWKLRVWNHMTEMQKLDILLLRLKVSHTYDPKYFVTTSKLSCITRKVSVCGMLFVFMELLASPEVMELSKGLSR
jgi:type IV secretory pathway protease TraF